MTPSQASSKDIAISVEKVSKHVVLAPESENEQGLLTIVDEVSLQIEAHTTVAIQGVSGSGKTTLLSLMAGLDLPSQGDVWLKGVRLCDLDEDSRTALRAQYTAFIFQQFLLIPHLTAVENVLLPLALLKGGSIRQYETEARHALAEVGLLARASHWPAQLSGGEQQRVAIARAFALAPQILFADEPTANLDAKTAEQIIQLLFRLHEQQHATLVFVTHDRHVAQACQQVWTLEAGRIVS